MEYAVLLYGDEAEWTTATEEEMAAVMAAHDRFSEAVGAGGGREVGGVELRLSPSARTLRWTGSGAPDVVDGPYAEAAEHLGGIYIIDAPDLDHMLEWCRLLPHTAEIRPTVPGPDEGAAGTDADANAVVDTAEGPGASPPAASAGQLEVLALLYGDEAEWAQADEAERQAIYAQHGRFFQAVVDAGGVVLGGAELAHSGNATTLRRGHDGGWTVTDGPFAESVEQLGGYYHLAAADMPTLEKVMLELPGGSCEIRPVAVG